MKIYETFEKIEKTVAENITEIKIKKTDGSSFVVKPFRYEHIDVNYNDRGFEKINSTGHDMRYRFCADTPGKYVVYEISGDKMVSEYEIEVKDGNKHGYVQVSDENRKYFSYTDGENFLPIGINMAFPKQYRLSNGKEFGLSGKFAYLGLRQYETWIKKASSAGVNLIRIWCGHDYFTPEHGDNNDFLYEQFSKVDKIFELAHKYNVKIKITIDQFRYFKYNEDGGYIEDLFGKSLYDGKEKCCDENEWLTDRRWQNLWLKKIEEYAKRYAYDDALFAVELWNEMNCFGCWWDSYNPNITQWNKTISREVKKLFPNHMVINSLGSYDSEFSKAYYDNLCWDCFDFKQIHSYLDQGAKFKEANDNPIEIFKRVCSEQSTDTQPIFIAETGAVNDNHSGPFRYYSADDDGSIFADCVYAPFFLGCAGCGNIWHWDDRYIEFKNLYHMYKPFKNLTDGIEIAKEEFYTMDCSDENAYILALKGKFHDLYYVRNKSASWKNMLRDDKDITILNEVNLKVDGKPELVHIWNDGETIEYNGEQAVICNLKKGIFVKVSKC